MAGNRRSQRTMSFTAPRRHSSVMRGRTVPAAAITWTLTLAGAAWIVAVTRMSRMDTGPGRDLGSLSFFAGTWTVMMAAMMLPSALPAVVAFERIARPRLAAVGSLLFSASYIAVWALVGVAAFAAYRGIRAADLGFLAWGRAGASVAGGAVVAAGLYELTPLKRACLGRCHAHVDRRAGNAVVAGSRYGANCVGCSAGLMLVLFALGVMSVTWMLVVAALVFVEKVPRFGARLVGPIAVLLVGLGLWIALDASSVPGLAAPM
jgi:predicted metal-binding membrane protein